MAMMEQDTDKMTPNDKAFNLPNLILNKKIFNSMVPVVSLKHKNMLNVPAWVVAFKMRNPRKVEKKLSLISSFKKLDVYFR